MYEPQPGAEPPHPSGAYQWGPVLPPYVGQPTAGTVVGVTRTVLTSAIVTGVVVAVVSAALMAFAFTSMTPADWAPETADPDVFSSIAAGGLVTGVMFVIGTNIGAVIGLLIAAIRREVWPVRRRQPHPQR